MGLSLAEMVGGSSVALGCEVEGCEGRFDVFRC